MAEQKYEVRQEKHGYTVYSPSGAAMPLVPFHQPEDLLPLWLDRTAGIGAYVAWLRASGTPESDWLWCSAVHQFASYPHQNWPHDLGPFLGAGIGWFFSRGVIGKGPRLAVSTLQALTCRVARFFGEMAVQALARHPADLMLFYQPAIDEISHQMLRDALADWPYGAAAQAMLAVHQEVDHQLGRLLEGLEDDDTLLISSDHGHEPIHRAIRPNVLLRQAGLLAIKGDKIDLARTHAVFHSSGWVLVNTTDRAGGIVPHGNMRQLSRRLSSVWMLPLIRRLASRSVCGIVGVSGKVTPHRQAICSSGPHHIWNCVRTSLGQSVHHPKLAAIIRPRCMIRRISRRSWRVVAQVCTAHYCPPAIVVSRRSFGVR